MTNELFEVKIPKNLEGLNKLLNGKKIDIAVRDEEGLTLLHYACLINCVQILNKFLKAGCDVNAKDYTGLTPLHYAIKLENIRIIHTLINHGADINIQDQKGETPIDIAIKTGNVALVRTFVFRRTDDLIYKACAAGHLDLLKFFLDTIDFDIDSQNDCGESLLHIACNKGYMDIIKFLVEEKKINIELLDSNRWTALYNAIQSNNVNVVELLINAGANIDRYDDSHDTALDIAYRCNRYCDNQKMIDIIEHGIPINAKIERMGMDLWPSSEILELVTNDTAGEIDPYILNNDGEELLYWALRYTGEVEIAKLLIERMPNVNLKTAFGQVPLFWAIKFNHREIIQLLIAKGADLNVVDDKNMTTLMLAAEDGNTEMVEMLINGGVDINAKDKRGMTALAYAINNAYYDKNIFTIQKLIDAGIDINTKDEYGKTPVMYCPDREKSRQILIMLLNAGLDLGNILPIKPKSL